MYDVHTVHMLLAAAACNSALVAVLVQSSSSHHPIWALYRLFVAPYRLFGSAFNADLNAEYQFYNLL